MRQQTTFCTVRATNVPRVNNWRNIQDSATTFIQLTRIAPTALTAAPRSIHTAARTAASSPPPAPRRAALAAPAIHVAATPVAAAAAATTHAATAHPTAAAPAVAAPRRRIAAQPAAAAAATTAPETRSHARLLHGTQLLVDLLLLLPQLLHLLQMRQMVLEQDDRIADALLRADEDERHLAVLARDARVRLVLAFDLRQQMWGARDRRKKRTHV